MSMEAVGRYVNGIHKADRRVELGRLPMYHGLLHAAEVVVFRKEAAEEGWWGELEPEDAEQLMLWEAAHPDVVGRIDSEICMAGYSSEDGEEAKPYA